MGKRGIRLCVYVCVDCNQVQVRVSIGFYSHVYLDFNSWICKIMLRSRVTPSFAYLECHCSLFRSRARSQTYLPSVATQVSTEPPRQETRPTTVKSTEDRKFNVVVYGLKECEEGTKDMKG